MFRHQGESRTIKHNLLLATILSFVAGIVNVSGFLSIHQLTTNVTGHFALFIYDVANFDFWRGAVYFLYILSFLIGSFTSGMLIEQFRKSEKLNVFFLPTILESVILIFIPLSLTIGWTVSADAIACLLLFAMGLQNSYVTKISNTVVRTTHLTGLFTDLGLELSQLFFPKTHPDRSKIKSLIRLRLFIICFFFLGGIAGGYMHEKLELKLNTLYLGAAILLLSLFYDDWLFKRNGGIKH